MSDTPANDTEPVWESEPNDTGVGTEPFGEPAGRVSEEPESLLSRIRWGLMAFIVLSLIVIVLAAQNTQSVTVKALGWEAQAPLVVIILITVLVTVILDELVGVIIRRRRRTRRAERRELKRLRNEQRS